VSSEKSFFRLFAFGDVFADDDLAQWMSLYIGNRIRNKRYRKERPIFTDIESFTLPLREFLHF